MKLMHLFYCSLIFFYINAMEVTEAPRMVKINTEQDVAPFVDKIVAFILNDVHPMGASWASYALKNAAHVKFGRIARAQTNGNLVCYQLTQIVETGTQGFCGILCDLYIKKGLLVRCADIEEIIALHSSIKNKKDNFVLSVYQASELHVFESQIEHDLQKKKCL